MASTRKWIVEFEDLTIWRSVGPTHIMNHIAYEDPKDAHLLTTTTKQVGGRTNPQQIPVIYELAADFTDTLVFAGLNYYTAKPRVAFQSLQKDREYYMTLTNFEKCAIKMDHGVLSGRFGYKNTGGYLSLVYKN